MPQRGAAESVSIVGRGVGAREVMWSGKKAESPGMNRRQLGKVVELIKKHYGLLGDHNFTIGRATGDVYDSKTGELLRNVRDEFGKW